MLKTIRNICQRVFDLDTVYGNVIRVQTGASQEGYFKAVTGNGIVAQPISDDDSILLTDLILTTDKVQAASATVKFTDGTDTINIIVAEVSDAPVNIAISFAGRWHGWAGARVELAIVGAITATVACGYMFVDRQHTIQSYSAWDAKRTNGE